MNNALDKIKELASFSGPDKTLRRKDAPALSSAVSSNLLSLGGSSEDNLQILYAPLHSTSPSLFSVVPLRGLGENRVSKVSSGGGQMLILVNTGVVVAFDGANTSIVQLPAPSESIACGQQFGAAVVQGQVHVWGRISVGKDTLFSSPSPVALSGPDAAGQIAATNFSLLAVSQSGKKVYTWGSNAEYCLGVDDKSSTMLVRQMEPVAFEGLAEDAVFALLHASGSCAVCLTDKGVLYSWGGGKKECRPVVVPTTGLPPEVSQVIAHSAGPMVVSKQELYWRKKSKWELLSQALGSTSRVAAFDDVVLSLGSSSGKVYRYSTKTSEGTWLQTIRVSDVCVSSNLVVLTLGVYNRRSRIFGTLHPEPMLKLATPKGFIEWICKTGCRYESDVGAFVFAAPVIFKGEPRKKKKFFLSFFFF
jgi:hypothetical protein